MILINLIKWKQSQKLILLTAPLDNYNDWLFSDETIKLYLKYINQLAYVEIDLGFKH